MAEQMSDQEQIELLKRIWKEYGFSVLLGTILAMIIWFGWVYWTSHERAEKENASTLYQELLANVNAAGEVVPDEKKAGEIKSDYASTVYGLMAMMQISKDASGKNDLDAAEKALADVDLGAMDPALRVLVSVRLARIAYAKAEYEKSISAIKAISDCAELKADCAEISGDSYRALGKMSEASREYKAAIGFLDEQGDSQRKKYLQMKLSDIPEEGVGLKTVDDSGERS